jgi:streptomycin 6-kinase
VPAAGDVVIDVPEIVRRKAVVAGADAWLDELPDLVERFERDWELTVGAAFTDATEAFVAPVRLSDGTRAVIKLIVPRDGNAARDEIAVLRLANGDGCAQLLRSDESCGALLIEHLGPSLNELGLPFEQRLQILTDVARRVWRPAPGANLPTGADKGGWLVEYITRMWVDLDRPCSERAVDYALVCADRRIAAHDDERAMLVHGDVHEWNALQSADGFKLVDPDGLLAEPEYDLGVLMREDPVELLAGKPYDRAYELAARTGLDAAAIWEWGVVERVSTGLVLTSIDLQPIARQMLHAADLVAPT